MTVNWRCIIRDIFLGIIFVVFALASSVSAQQKSDVALLQFQLNSLGFDAGAVDGLWGGSTRRALTEFFDAHEQGFDGSFNAEVANSVAIEFNNLPKGQYVDETAPDIPQVAS